MTTPAESKQAQIPETVKPTPVSMSPAFTLLLCVLSVAIGALGFRYFSTTSTPKDSDQIVETPSSQESKTMQPSPTPITLHAGKGDYAVSHPKSNGPSIQRVIFDPLDAKKGEKVKFSAVIMDAIGDAKVVGTLDADSKQIELTFTKDRLENNAQIWSTELILTESVLYHYTLTVSATNSRGNTVVRVSPRS